MRASYVLRKTKVPLKTQAEKVDINNNDGPLCFTVLDIVQGNSGASIPLVVDLMSRCAVPIMVLENGQIRQSRPCSQDILRMALFGLPNRACHGVVCKPLCGIFYIRMMIAPAVVVIDDKTPTTIACMGTFLKKEGRVSPIKPLTRQ